MKTLDAFIYHCVSCGRIVHAKSGEAPPQCCGKVMANACKDTTPKDDATQAAN